MKYETGNALIYYVKNYALIFQYYFDKLMIKKQLFNGVQSFPFISPSFYIVLIMLNNMHIYIYISMQV